MFFFDFYNVLNLQVMLKPPMFIYGRANCERIYVLGWSGMKLDNFELW
jgi:hypothetical protein